MANNPSNDISYYLSVTLAHKEDLGVIRHWGNLRIAFEEDLVWVKDFTVAQINSLEVKTIPYKEVYYTTGGKLFKWGSRLPHQSVPALLWTPIERGLPITLPAFNHNYFGISDKATIRLAPSDKERDAFGLLTTLPLLKTYVESAPTIRLQHLHWALVDDDKAIVLGEPQLPVPGVVFWQQCHFLIPAGYDFQIPMLTETVQTMLSSNTGTWVIWEINGCYWSFNKSLLQPLSISSFRKSISV